MTITRKLARKIAKGVVRMASPGAKEWARGIARELDFIEGDASALLWALGSMRVLLHRPPVPVDSPNDIQRESAKMRRGSNVEIAVTLATIACAVFTILRLPTVLDRTGASLITGSLLYTAWQHYAARYRVPRGSGSAGGAVGYRENLVLQRNLHRGWPLWSRLIPLFCGIAFLVEGRLTRTPETAARLALACVCAVLTVHGIRKKAAKYQRQIDEFDALPKASF